MPEPILTAFEKQHQQRLILVMSATFSQPNVIGHYLESITERNFIVYESQERATELVFTPKKPAQLFSIHDALVFVFTPNVEL